jgi:hypothetical protein
MSILHKDRSAPPPVAAQQLQEALKLDEQFLRKNRRKTLKLQGFACGPPVAYRELERASPQNRMPARTMKDLTMSNSGAVQNRQEALMRSCLESAPESNRPGRAASWGAGRKRGPVQLHLLKQKLLNAALEQTTLPQIHKQLCGAANEAAEAAWDTAFPLLSFPCLFEEMVQAICSRSSQASLVSDSMPLAA